MISTTNTFMKKESSKSKNSSKPQNSKQGDIFYILPMLIYIFVPLFLTQLGIHAELAYGIKTVSVGLLLILFIRKYKEIQYTFSRLSVIIGAVIFIIWVGTILLTHDATEATKAPDTYRILFYSLHFLGAVLVAPLIEELFVRSYLIRILVSNNWRSVYIGKATMPSFLVTVLFFGLAHQQIVAGLIVGVILNLMLYYTQNISDCIVAHSVANLLLYFYVVFTNSYFLW